MKILKNICYFIVIGVITNFFCNCIKSTYLLTFLDNNVVLIILTLMAINTTTSSFVISKLCDITRDHGISFKETYKELKLSLIEQLILLIVAIISLTVIHSKILVNLDPSYIFLLNSLIIAVFIYDIDILRDTGISIFEIFDALEKIDR